LIEVAGEHQQAFAATVPSSQIIGVTLADPVVVLGDVSVDLDQIGAAWRDTPDDATTAKTEVST
jgi:hypothetical protein